MLSWFRQPLLWWAWVLCMLPAGRTVHGQTERVAQAEQATQPIRFQYEVLPILSNYCFPCHGPDASAREAELRLDLLGEATAEERQRVLVSYHPDKSELVRRIESDDPDEVMPPAEAPHKLSATEKRTLREWIATGAHWQQHWAFEKPRRNALPSVANTTWPRNPIDYFVLSKMEQLGIAPSSEATRRELARRVSLDLTGLPPTIDEIQSFVNDSRPDAYEQFVDHLLASPRYGERMALPWLEAARFADTDGYQYDGPRTMWRWRDWVIEAYNQNTPFDQFTVEQLAGDLLPTATLDQKMATGFNRNHRYNSEAGLVVEEFLLENAVDRVDTTSTVWLGLTIGCARCHDHKYDPISQRDYYQLLAFFNNVPEAGRAIKADNSEPYIVAPTRRQQAVLAKLDQAVESSRAALETPGICEQQRRWELATFGESGRNAAAFAVANSRRGNAGETEAPRDAAPVISRQLAEHYPFDRALPAESKTQDGGQIEFAPGVFGHGVHFDGETTLLVSNRPKTKPPRFGNFSCTDKYTLSFWIRPDDVEQGVIVSRQSSGMGRQGSAVLLREGHIVYHVVSRWIAGAGIIETKEPIRAGEWVHVAVSHDGSQRATEQKIYIDGKRVPVRVLVNTNSNTGGANATAPLRIGGSPHGKNFVGALDDFRYYRTELRPDEVEVLSEKLSVEQIASTDPVKRTSKQQAKLRMHFLERGLGHQAYTEYLNAIRARDQYLAKLPTTMVMQERPDPQPTYVRVRGEYDKLGDQVKPGVPGALPPMPDDYSKDRLGLAQWLVSGDHPLTARVAVNRYWQMYFGVGLVATPEDFGVQGEKPSHPQLLDWLATEFVRTGWNVAAMQRLIVTSATYRQSSRTTPENLARDPGNRLLSRGPRVRLPAAVLRDQALALGGLLQEQVGGPSVSPYQPADLWIEMSMGRRYKLSRGADLFRRSLYTVWKRTVNPPSMAILDAADRESCWVGMKRTNTPLQALVLLNEPAFVESAKHLAMRMLESNQPVRHGFELTTGRPPNEDELTILKLALQVYRDDFAAHPDRANAVLAVGTTKISEQAQATHTPAEIAAHTALANVLLNLDQTVTNE